MERNPQRGRFLVAFGTLAFLLLLAYGVFMYAFVLRAEARPEGQRSAPDEAMVAAQIVKRLEGQPRLQSPLAVCERTDRLYACIFAATEQPKGTRECWSMVLRWVGGVRFRYGNPVSATCSELMPQAQPGPGPGGFYRLDQPL